MLPSGLFRAAVCATIGHTHPDLSECLTMDAKTVDARTHEFDVQDIEYLRHGDKPLLARLFKPRGTGPFPLIVELHGGAWCKGDRTNDTLHNEPLAKSGVP